MPGLVARRWPPALAALLALMGVGLGGARGADPLDLPMPPPVPRECRAVWVATVNNIDWPSRPGLPVATQQAEARALLDRARTLHLNTVILQVRTAADALYRSPTEPWSAVLTGTQGQDPGYDPLEFWLVEAHARGLLLHAWINPFRARIAGAKVAEAAHHVSQTHPNLVRAYGTSLWLDPGEPDARAATLEVARQLASRYDIDGLHIDDYFYPYPIADPHHAGQELPFPDDASFARARAAGVTLDRPAWRRDNINRVVRDLYSTVRRERPDVLVGISPFGIVRPGVPAGVKGFDQYSKLSADAGLWFASGWCDYLAPQLYWRVDAPDQPFAALLASWAALNTAEPPRHLWPGLAISRVGDGPKGYAPGEIARQIALLRESGTATGHVLFSARALERNPQGLVAELAATAYPSPALVPPTSWLKPWLGAEVPPTPRITFARVDGRDPADPRAATFGLAPGGEPADFPFLWVYQFRVGGAWGDLQVHPVGDRPSRRASRPGEPPVEAIAIQAVNRLGVTSAVVVAPFEVAPAALAPPPPRTNP